MTSARTLLLAAALTQLACAATAQKPAPGSVTEVPFRIVSAAVETFEHALPRRGREPYRQALVVRVAVEKRLADALSPSVQPYLYLGTLELHLFVNEDQGDVYLWTYHLPEWRELREPVPMVITTQRGDPIRDPERYRNYPRFDPRIIRD